MYSVIAWASRLPDEGIAGSEEHPEARRGVSLPKWRDLVKSCGSVALVERCRIGSHLAGKLGPRSDATLAVDLAQV